MRALVLVATMAVALSAATAQADPVPVLDGKKVTTVYVTGEAPRGAPAIDPTAAQLASCVKPACLRAVFIYRPAKGVTAPLSIKAKAFFPVLTDVDLYLVQGTTVVASCTGTTSSLRYLSLPPSKLIPGKSYTAIGFVSHSIGETISVTVNLPGKPAPKSLNVDKFDSSTTYCGT